ncbi:MAG: ParB/RepB/Spo0J family partition protein [Syntrophorhabdaceae bacterium]|nr:ParB/RepB/Spo0J family partition protein [Syntrophorhabdaceae bacterium]
MEKIEFAEIELEKIDIGDERFRVSYPLEDQSLIKSIEKAGILQPLTVLKGEPYIVVTGFKRLHGAILLGYKKVPAFVVNRTEKECMLKGIYDNLNRGLNTVEKVRLVERAKYFGLSKEMVVDVMEALSMRGERNIDRSIFGLWDMEEWVKSFVATKNLSIGNTVKLLRFEREEMIKIIELLSPIHTTEGSTRELLDMLMFLKIKKGGIDFSLFKNSKSCDELRGRVKRLIHPRLTFLEEEYKRLKAACALSPNIDIKVDPFFEKDYISITIKARREKEIIEAVKKLESITNKGLMGEIIGLTSC